jgi:hypothetical protein
MRPVKKKRLGELSGNDQMLDRGELGHFIGALGHGLGASGARMSGRGSGASDRDMTIERCQ